MGQEKIGRSLIPHEQFLQVSFHGKFFARSLNLPLLQRRPYQWKELQSSSKASANTSAREQTIAVAPPAAKRGVPEDEIDAVFNAALGNQVKRGAIGKPNAQEKKSSTDGQMQRVLDAIEAAPAGEDGRSRKRRKR